MAPSQQTSPRAAWFGGLPTLVASPAARLWRAAPLLERAASCRALADRAWWVRECASGTSQIVLVRPPFAYAVHQRALHFGRHKLIKWPAKRGDLPQQISAHVR